MLAQHVGVVGLERLDRLDRAGGDVRGLLPTAAASGRSRGSRGSNRTNGRCGGRGEPAQLLARRRGRPSGRSAARAAPCASVRAASSRRAVVVLPVPVPPQMNTCWPSPSGSLAPRSPGARHRHVLDVRRPRPVGERSRLASAMYVRSPGRGSRRRLPHPSPRRARAGAAPRRRRGQTGASVDRPVHRRRDLPTAG